MLVLPFDYAEWSMELCVHCACFCALEDACGHHRLRLVPSLIVPHLTFCPQKVTLSLSASPTTRIAGACGHTSFLWMSGGLKSRLKYMTGNTVCTKLSPQPSVLIF